MRMRKLNSDSWPSCYLRSLRKMCGRNRSDRSVLGLFLELVKMVMIDVTRTLVRWAKLSLAFRMLELYWHRWDQALLTVRPKECSSASGNVRGSNTVRGTMKKMTVCESFVDSGAMTKPIANLHWLIAREPAPRLRHSRCATPMRRTHGNRKLMANWCNTAT